MKMSDSLSFALLRIAAAWPSFALCGVWVGLGERDGGTTSGQTNLRLRVGLTH
jgi:hypothetical protein